MNFKTVIDKIVEGGKLILAQPTFIFKDKEEDESVSVEDSLESIVINCVNDVIEKATQGAVNERTKK